MLKDAITRCPLIAILRGLRPEEAESIGMALVNAGISIIEVPLNSPEPLESIRRLACSFGEKALIGAGTVTRVEDVARLCEAGGKLPKERDKRGRAGGGGGSGERSIPWEEVRP